jgi:hypothetical protein
VRQMKPRAPGSASQALALMSEQIGASQGMDATHGVKLMADFIGKSVGTIYKMLDPDQREQLSFARVAQLTDRYKATAAADYLAQLANCLLVPLPPVEPGDAIDEHTIRSAREYADMVAAIITAKRDGRITRPEARALLRDIRELMIELAALAEAIKAVADNSALSERTPGARPFGPTPAGGGGMRRRTKTRPSMSTRAACGWCRSARRSKSSASRGRA